MTHSLAKIPDHVARDLVVRRMEEARVALSKAVSIDQVKLVMDAAAAQKVFARRQQLGKEAIELAREVEVLALARLGELLKPMIKAKGTRGQLVGRKPSGGTAMEPPEANVPTLAELGISKKVASIAQQLAILPVKTREAIAQGEVTITQATREAQRVDRREQAAKVVTPAELIEGSYQCVVIDPPWDAKDEGDCDQMGRAQPLYATIPIDKMVASAPVDRMASKNAHLYLWITNRSLPKGFPLLEAWGFRYVTMLTWCKPSIGIGNYYRNNTEHVLFGVRGQLPLLEQDIGTWFTAPRGKTHSAKPDEFYRIVERASPGPRLDMFYGKKREGWMPWGTGE